MRMRREHNDLRTRTDISRSDLPREIVRDEIYNIIRSPNLCISKSLKGSFQLTGTSLTQDPDSPVITFTKRRDYRRTSLNEIDNAARFLLIFGISSIDLIVMHNNNYRIIGSFAYEDPELFDNLFQLLFEKCELKTAPSPDGTNDRTSLRTEGDEWCQETS